LLDLWPQLCLLLSFGAFVVWNGGVVLGDKDNHVATVHLPQMLYIWPLIVFFSWPVLLPQLNHLASFRRRLPRLNTTITWIVLMLVTVNLNTVVHPFTLADNRHYTFYVFRLLRQHWLGKYAAVPVYYLCACLVLGALGGATTEPAPTHKSAEVVYSADTDDTICVSFVLVWLVATSLSLVTAPLVEPRYFILPWLMWRLAVPEHIPRSNVKAKVQELENKTAPPTSASPSQDHPAPALSSGLQRILATAASYSASLELVWYVLVNLATCYMFLFKGFEWLQEPDSVQRFMW
jgi:alpha-1,2-glucosyltransferase